MGIEVKKSKVNNKMYDVTSLENFVQNKDLYDQQYTAIQVNDMVLPVIGRLDERTGICVQGNMVAFYNEPPKDRMPEFSAKNIIDLSRPASMKELLEKQEYVKSLENEIIVNSENVFEPRIDDTDSPEMKALKEAVLAKQIDINAYAPRFKGNFANDKRLFNDDKITLSKIKKITNALDMKCSLIIEDKNSTVPNPIGRTIVVDITGGGDDDDE